MAKHIERLKEAQVRNAKPRQKLYRLSDGDGFVLVVSPERSPLLGLSVSQTRG